MKLLNTKKLNRILNTNQSAEENILRLTYKCGFSYYDRGYLRKRFHLLGKEIKHPTINYTNPNTFHYNNP